MDLHVELVEAMQTLRKENAQLRSQVNALAYAQAVDSIRYESDVVRTPRALRGIGIPAVIAALEQMQAQQRALTTMRVFHFQWKMPRPVRFRPKTPLPVESKPAGPGEDAGRAAVETLVGSEP